MSVTRHTHRHAAKLTWYAFRVRPQEERKIARRLRWIGFNALVPVFRHWRKRNKYTQAKTLRERPIMPGYVWIGMSEPIPWWRLLGREDIFSVVSFGGRPAPMNGVQVAKMLANESKGVFADSDDWRNMRSGREYSVGDEVEFETQGFEGFTGKVIDLNASDARILFEMFGTEREIIVPVAACSKVA